jgi:hypothetical protein
MSAPILATSTSPTGQNQPPETSEARPREPALRRGRDDRSLPESRRSGCVPCGIRAGSCQASAQRRKKSNRPVGEPGLGDRFDRPTGATADDRNGDDAVVAPGSAVGTATEVALSSGRRFGTSNRAALVCERGPFATCVTDWRIASRADRCARSLGVSGGSADKHDELAADMPGLAEAVGLADLFERECVGHREGESPGLDQVAYLP